MQDEEIETKEFMEKVKQFVYLFRWVITGFILVTVFFLLFKAGGLYACRGGHMNGMTCVEPQTIDIVQQCAYGFDCEAQCRAGIIQDREAFCDNYYPAGQHFCCT